MKTRSRWIVALPAIAIVTVVGWILFGQIRDFREVRKDLEGLSVNDVDSLRVYDGDFPMGEGRVIKDRTTIMLVISCLRSGEPYTANHDKQNGFERVVMIEPQGIHMRIYQKVGDQNYVIVSFGEFSGETHYSHYGSIRCSSGLTWKGL
jgi:hypothetical protein